MLRLKNYSTCPPDLYSYKFPEDGFIASSYDHLSWLEKIKKHALDNGYPVPSQETVEDQLCRRLSGEFCIGGGPHSFVNTRFTLNDFLRGTKVLASFVLRGRVVSKDVAESRALICSRCPLNVRVPGCASCTGMANAVAEAKGAQSTKYDYLLKACSVCLCSNEAQIWIPIEYLRTGLTDEMIGQYHQLHEDGYDCWKAAELEGD